MVVVEQALQPLVEVEAVPEREQRRALAAQEEGEEELQALAAAQQVEESQALVALAPVSQSVVWALPLTQVSEPVSSTQWMQSLTSERWHSYSM